MTILAILIVGIAAFATARSIRIARLRQVAQTRLSVGENQSLTNQISGMLGENVTKAELGAYGSVTLAEFVWDWHTIDPSIIQAAQFSSTDNISNGWDFASYIHNHYDTLSAAGKEGFAARLEGYVAEQHVAASFEQAGHMVQVASTANQPVWDMLIDGNAINVKDVASVGSIKADALAHPDITYVTPGHLSSDGIANIHPLPDFNHDAIKESVKDGVASAHGEHAMQALGLHIPFITVGFTAYRKYKLVKYCGQHPAVAIKHGVIESIGRGAGVVAGGKIGAIAGFACGGPLGALIGGIGLGIGGALFGGGIAESIKRKPLLNAISEMETALDAFGRDFKAKLPAMRNMLTASNRKIESARRTMTDALAVYTANWKIKVWPDMYSVVLEESLNIAGQVSAKEHQVSSKALSVINQIEQSGEWRTLGLIMANSPEIRNRVGYTESMLDRISALRKKILTERKHLNPMLDLPN